MQPQLGTESELTGGGRKLKVGKQYRVRGLCRSGGIKIGRAKSMACTLRAQGSAVK